MDLIQLVGTVVGTSGLTGFFSYMLAKAKLNKESEDSVRAFLKKILDEERKENATCEERVTTLTGRVEELLVQNSALKAQIETLEESLKSLRELLLAHYSYTK